MHHRLEGHQMTVCLRQRLMPFFMNGQDGRKSTGQVTTI